MSAGIDLESLMKKGTRSKSNGGKSSTNKGKTTGIKVDPAQVIDSGIKVIDGLTNLIKTINEQKQMTMQAKERTKQIRIESEERIETLKKNIELEVTKMKTELEKYKEDNKFKIRELEENTNIELKNIDLRELNLKNIHERNMRLIDQQEKALDAALELHTMYYKRKIMGEYVGIDNPNEITLVLNSCINNMKEYIKALNTQNNYTDAEYTQE